MEERNQTICHLREQGLRPGSCKVRVNHKYEPACQATLKWENGQWHRLITTIHLSRPENYLSIYQSGCNFSCKKCHSWYFSKVKDGTWYTPEDILKQCQAYEKKVTLWEPRERATSWHAHDTCRCCGRCVTHGERSSTCPKKLQPETILPSPQGFGPARSVVAFTGGDLTCRPQFYGECARLIKERTKLWLLLETNGYGLTPENLDYLKEAGVDAFWLDIKAHDPEKHRWLTGCSNEHILGLPEEIIKREFTLEILSLYIPELVETDEIVKIAEIIRGVDADIPFTILAFFPEHEMTAFRSPSVLDMVAAYQKVKALGLRNIRLGNPGVFAGTMKDRLYLAAHVARGDY